MRLRELDGDFIGRAVLGDDGDVKQYEIVDTLAEAQGVNFQCPLCAQGKEVGAETIDGRERRFVRGAHYVICWFADRGIPPTANPKPGRWNPSGTGLDDLTFVPPGAVSVLLMGGCNWHGFVRGGDAS